MLPPKLVTIIIIINWVAFAYIYDIILSAFFIYYSCKSPEQHSFLVISQCPKHVFSIKLQYWYRRQRNLYHASTWQWIGCEIPNCSFNL